MAKEPISQPDEDRIEELIDRNNVGDLKAALREMHPADIAEILSDLPEDDLSAVFKHIDSNKAGVVLDEMSPEAKQDVIESIDETRLATIINDLPPDEQADIMGTVDDEKRLRILKKLDAESTRDIGELLKYSADTAGGLMTTEFVALQADVAVKEATALWQSQDDPNLPHYTYIVDGQSRLQGVVGDKALIRAGESEKLSSIMATDIISVDINTDQEEVAQIFRKYDLMALPVVDEQQVLKGVITVDDVLEVIRDENSEDFYRMGGTGEMDPFHETVLKKSLKRLPWLSVTLLGGLITVSIMHNHNSLLLKFTFLAFFVPVIIATAGNVAIQSATVIVRGLALGEAKSSNLFSDTFREVRVGVTVGLFCSLVCAVFAGLYKGWDIGLVIGISMMCAITVASFNGVLIPRFCHRIGIDPAIVAGPFITTLNDILGVLIYFAVAALLMV